MRAPVDRLPVTMRLLVIGSANAGLATRTKTMSTLQAVAIRTITTTIGMTIYNIVDKQTGWVIAEDCASSYQRALTKAQSIDASLTDPEQVGWNALDLI